MKYFLLIILSLSSCDYEHMENYQKRFTNYKFKEGQLVEWKIFPKDSVIISSIIHRIFWEDSMIPEYNIKTKKGYLEAKEYELR